MFSFLFLFYLAHGIVLLTTCFFVGNPLHSTAVEEDLSMSEQGQEYKGSTGENDHRQLSKTAAQQRGAPVKRKEMDREEEEEEEEEKKKKRKGMGGEVKAR